jgi:hypothetical protein
MRAKILTGHRLPGLPWRWRSTASVSFISKKNNFKEYSNNKNCSYYNDADLTRATIVLKTEKSL